MAYQSTKSIISVLLHQLLQERLSKLETTFNREESDLAVIKVSIDIMRKSIQRCVLSRHKRTWSSTSEIQSKDNAKKLTIDTNSRTLKRSKTSLAINPLKKEEKKEKNESTIIKLKRTQSFTQINKPSISKISRDIRTHVKTPSSISVQIPRTKPTTPCSKSHEPPKEEKRVIKKALTENPAQLQTIKPTLLKSNTKGELLLTMEMIATDHSGYHRRLATFSGVMKNVLQSNDELLTKVDFTPEATKMANPIPTSSLTSKKDYFEIIYDKWVEFFKYLNRYDQMKLLLVNKVLAKITFARLIRELQEEIMNIEGKLEVIQNKFHHDAKDYPSFTLSKGAVKAIELLNEDMYYQLFVENCKPGDDAILIYRVLFQLMNTHAEIASISDNQCFWTCARNYIINASDRKIGKYLELAVKSLDFSDENIYRVSKMVALHVSEITPFFFTKTCPTTGLVAFLVKDALEYAGIIQDKKTHTRRIYCNNKYSLEILRKKLERMKEKQIKYFGKD